MSRWMMVAGTKWALAQNWLFRQTEKVRNDRGQSTIEYLGLAAVLVAILVVVMSLKGQVAQAVVGKLTEFIENIKVN